MKYQVEYERSLITGSTLIEETGEIIGGVSVWIRFSHVYESDNPTVNRDSEKNNRLLTFSYSPDTQTFEFNADENLTAFYEIVGYTKDVGDIDSEETLVATLIDKKEFDFIVNKYGHLFWPDKSLSSDAYHIHKLERDAVNSFEQMMNYNYIQTGLSLDQILKDIDLDSITNMHISDYQEHLEDAGTIQNRFINLKYVIDRFKSENLDLSRYSISEEPITDSFVVVSDDKKYNIGVQMHIENKQAVPYYLDDNVEKLPNLFKANTIIEAFEKSKN